MRYPYPISGEMISPLPFKACADRLAKADPQLSAYWRALYFRFSFRQQRAFNVLVPIAEQGSILAAKELCFLQSDYRRFRGGMEWCKRLQKMGDVLGHNLVLRDQILYSKTLDEKKLFRNFTEKADSTKITILVSAIVWLDHYRRNPCRPIRMLQRFARRPRFDILEIYGSYGLKHHVACGRSSDHYLDHLIKAAEHPLSGARFNLYVFYKHGAYGVPKHPNKSIYWLCRIRVQPLRAEIFSQLRNKPDC